MRAKDGHGESQEFTAVIDRTDKVGQTLGRHRRRTTVSSDTSPFDGPRPSLRVVLRSGAGGTEGPKGGAPGVEESG